MASSILQKASAWRTKYIGKASSSPSRTAVVVGATSGIGQAISHRLAEQGWKIVAVGRHREGRAEEIVEALVKSSPKTDDSVQHIFVACDCFSLKSVQSSAQEIRSKHDGNIDALVLTQGMATAQGFTPTEEGNDEKLTLHYFSRMAFSSLLLPALNKSTMPKGAVVLSVLSGGVHSPYGKYKEDFSLAKNYSIKNAADAAGYYNDLGLDALAHANPKLNFVHAAPGFVNTNWGTEFNPILRALVRCMQPLGKKPSECAEYMVGPTILASAYNDDLPPKSSDNGVIVMGEKGQSAKLTKAHTEDAIDSVWKSTVETLKKAGITVN
jgi:NAD(P)-dependent dehydrogenase (short-subunit alcohol dehydrogenase family)